MIMKGNVDGGASGISEQIVHRCSVSYGILSFAGLS